jgi:hypothetical protein
VSDPAAILAGALMIGVLVAIYWRVVVTVAALALLVTFIAGAHVVAQAIAQL